jgi:hypothetical protein
MANLITGDVLICGYCRKPVIEGPAFYDPLKCCYVHYKFPTTIGDAIVCGPIGHGRDEEILNKPFELIEREVENLSEKDKPSCMIMYILMEGKKRPIVTMSPVLVHAVREVVKIPEMECAEMRMVTE